MVRGGHARASDARMCDQLSASGGRSRRRHLGSSDHVRRGSCCRIAQLCARVKPVGGSVCRSCSPETAARAGLATASYAAHDRTTEHRSANAGRRIRRTRELLRQPGGGGSRTRGARLELATSREVQQENAEQLGSVLRELLSRTAVQ